MLRRLAFAPAAAVALALALFAPAQANHAKKPAPTAKPSSGGLHTGITVHGWWKIDVKNPDGKVARHVEFENSLDPGFLMAAPGTTVFQVPGGASLLLGLLSGSGSAPTSWAVVLEGASGLANLGTANGSPCLTDIATTGQIGACVIGTTSSIGAIGIGTFGVSDGCRSANSVLNGVFCGLSISVVNGGLVLSGSATAEQKGVIATVGTLTAVPTVTGGLGSFTSSTNFPGAPISVIAGQIIAVSVTISFQ